VCVDCRCTLYPLKRNIWQPKVFLNVVNYKAHGWLVCGDFRITGLLLGLQADYTKTPSFLNELNSRTKSERWERHNWPPRKSLTLGSKNVMQEPGRSR
jgi:hypothetical protein